MRLPPRTQPKRRQRWVRQAVRQAKEQLAKMEKDAVVFDLEVGLMEDSGGASSSSTEAFEDEFPDAWQ